MSKPLHTLTTAPAFFRSPIRFIAVATITLAFTLTSLTASSSGALAQAPAQSPSQVTSAPFLAPESPVETASIVLKATAWGPPVNGGADCGGTVCQVTVSIKLKPEWADYANRMTDAGISGLYAVLEGCPDSEPRGLVLRTSGTAKTTIGCGYSKYYNVPDTPVVRFEWYFEETKRYVATGGVAPTAAPDPYLYYGDLPITEKKREIHDTAWGPTKNSGITCSHISSPGVDTACSLKLWFTLNPSWENYIERMASMGKTEGRVTIEDSCPADSDFGVAYLFSARSHNLSNRTLTCGWNMYYTVPTERIGWRFEWRDTTTNTWEVSGGQRSLEEAAAVAYPNLDLNEYAANIASSIALSRVCEPLLFVPNTASLSSVPKEYQSCTAMVATGRYNARQLLGAMAALYGPTVLDTMTGPDKRDADSPVITAPAVRSPGRSTSDEDPSSSLPSSGNSAIVAAWMAADPSLSDNDAGMLATQCRTLVSNARIASVLDRGGILRHPCEMLPIFVPGSDAESAAQHKLRSILANPTSVLLHNASAASTEARLQAEGYIVGGWDIWRFKVPPSSTAYTSVSGTPCSPGSVGLGCDEYPYAASLEGGPRGNPEDPASWTGFTLDSISKDDNDLEGNRFSAFKVDDNCGLTEQGPQGQTIPGVEFLVIPMPGKVPTTHICTAR